MSASVITIRRKTLVLCSPLVMEHKADGDDAFMTKVALPSFLGGQGVHSHQVDQENPGSRSERGDECRRIVILRL